MRKEIQTLEARIEVLKEELAEVSHKAEKYKIKYGLLKEKFCKLADEKFQFEHRNEHLEAENEHLETENEQLKKTHTHMDGRHCVCAARCTSFCPQSMLFTKVFLKIRPFFIDVLRVCLC